MRSQRHYLSRLADTALVGAILLATVVAAEPPPAKTAATVAPSGGLTFSFKKDSGQAVVPFKQAGAHLFVPVQINGQDAGDFLVDTGAYCNLLDTATAERLKVPVTGRWSIAGVGGADRASVCKLESLSLGDMELHNHSLTQYDVDRVWKSIGVKAGGILGAPFWCQVPFTVDYQASTLTFHHPNNFKPPPNARAERIEFANGHPIVPCKLDGKLDGWFLLDTGAGGEVSVDNGFLEAHPDLLAGRPQFQVEVGGIVGTEAHLSSFLNTFEIFSTKLERIPATFGIEKDRGLPPNAHAGKDQTIGLVGEGILRRFRMTFDYENRKLWVEAAGPEPDIPAERVNDRDLAGFTPVMKAIFHQNPQQLEELLKKGPNLEVKSNAGVTALLLAVQTGSSALVRPLLEKAADLGAKDPDGVTPLGLASCHGHAEIADLLIAKGADMETAGFEGRTCLMVAATNGHLEVVKRLVEKKAKLEAKDAIGLTPLMMAANEGKVDVVRFLLEKGADPKSKSIAGGTALDLAKKHPEVLELLKKAAAPDPK